jgi:hypothetical protein
MQKLSLEQPSDSAELPPGWYSDWAGSRIQIWDVYHIRCSSWMDVEHVDVAFFISAATDSQNGRGTSR